MTKEKRQELFQDAEPAADEGKFRLVAGVMGVAVLLAVGWIAMSLEHLKDELRSLEEDESEEIAVLSAGLTALRQETGEKFHSVKGTLSGIWHQHKPAELEFMGFLASRNAEEREALLAALDGSRPSTGEGVLSGEPAPVPAPEPAPVPEPPHEPTPEPEPDRSSAKFKEYRIQPGNSLSRIAQEYKVSAQALARANGITNPNRIRVGQVIKIPVE
ncbi:MAG: LysM peptidoglycan-binding domain-containing protein [Verrucomicrobiota bacterium]|nr:LysM peptidoglycan-binding domain-containing protein [Verrucomicrobiota bacterium]